MPTMVERAGLVAHTIGEAEWARDGERLTMRVFRRFVRATA
jgi:hypothetical protein